MLYLSLNLPEVEKNIVTYLKIANQLKQSSRAIYQTVPKEFRAIYAMLRIASAPRVPKKAYAKSDITRLVNQMLKSEGIARDLEAQGLRVPNIDWGKLFMVAISQMARRYDMSQTQKEDFLVDVVGDMVMGQSIITVRDTGPWKRSLTKQIQEWVEAGYDDNRIKASLISWIKDKIANLYKRWLVQRGHGDDIGFEVGSPSDEYQGRDVYENLFTLDGLSRAQMSTYQSLIRSNPVVRDIVKRITQQLERRDDSIGYIWQAYLNDPAATLQELFTVPVDATIEGRRQRVPLWKAMGYDGPNQKRQKLDYHVKKLRKHLKQMWPDIDDVLRDLQGV